MVKVNNLCPNDPQNPLCAQPEGKSSSSPSGYENPLHWSGWGSRIADCGWGGVFLDVDINFDLCQDSGAAAALFGSSGTQQVNGTAAIVHCSEEWTGGANVCLPGVESC